MTAPAQPTETTIITEAYAQVGLPTPTTAQLTRGSAYGFAKVKDDIWALGRRWKALRTSQYQPVTKGVSRYANPSDYEVNDGEPAFSLLDGNSYGVLAAVAAPIYTLAATDPIQQGQAEGSLLVITSGTGSGQADQIQSYNSTTKQATLRTSLAVTPVVGSGYLVATRAWPMEQKPWARRTSFVEPMLEARPHTVFEEGSGGQGFVELYPVPDQTYYAYKRNYFSNLLLLDTSSALYNQLLYQWRGVFTAGLIYWLTMGYDDTRAQAFKQDYLMALRNLVARELVLQDEANLQQQVTD